MKHCNLWLIVIHTDTFSEVTIPTVAVVVFLALAKHFFTISKIKQSQQVSILEEFALDLTLFASLMVSVRCNLSAVNPSG